MKAFLIFLLGSFLTLSGTAQTTDTLVSGTNTVSKTRITSNEFNRLMQNVQNQSPESTRAATLKETFINTTYFATAQIKKLLSSVPKDSDKLALARSAYDRVTDPNNFIQLADLFRSNTYRREFVLWVQNPDK